MNYKTLTINTALPSKPKAKVMIIYTGGTFGMIYDHHGVLLPFDFSLILEQLPTLRHLFLEITVELLARLPVNPLPRQVDNQQDDPDKSNVFEPGNIF